MLDRLNGFCNHAITDIKILVDAHYAFCRQPDISNYVMDLLYKDKFSCDDIEEVSNKKPYCEKVCL